MATTQAKAHFSDLMMANSFPHALSILRDIYRHEARLQSQQEPGEPPQELTTSAQSFLNEYEAQRSKADMIYEDYFERPLRETEDRLLRETADAMRAAGLDQYADALETGDYSGLAL